jgi:hypothetical protein
VRNNDLYQHMPSYFIVQEKPAAETRLSLPPVETSTLVTLSINGDPGLWGMT